MTGMIRIDNAQMIGKAIRDLRAMTMLSQKDLSREAQGAFVKGQVSGWELGRTAPSVLSLIRLAHAFDYDLALVPRATPAEQGEARPGCDCGHEGLAAMFHLQPCPVAVLRDAARKLGYDLVPREDV